MRVLLATVVVGACGGAAPPTPAGEASTSGGATADASTAAAEASTGASAGATGGPSSSETTDAGATAGETDGEPPGPGYDQVQQKSAHNAYQRDESLFDLAAYHRVRSLELDVHVGKTLEPDLVGDWYVYHSDVVDDATSCRTLADCLDALGAFMAAVPAHEITTLWIDLKDPFDAEHTPSDLDARLAEAFAGGLWSPAHQRAACPGARSLREAVLARGCGWPRLERLRGRVIVVLTGSDASLGNYLGDDPFARAAFVAPAYVDAARIAGTDAVFFNAAAADLDAVPAIGRAGLVARVWDVNTEATWLAALAAGAHHVATDKVNFHTDPWARTHGDDGWPFACAEPSACAGQGPEAGRVLGIDVDSGDAWGTADSMWLLAEDEGAAPDGVWSAWIAAESSWVEPFAKACLVARASLVAGAASFAVCRPADAEPLRVQIRASDGASTTAIEADVVDASAIAPEGVPFVRLAIEQGGTCARGEGSLDGARWVVIGEACFASPLPIQGLSASSHDGGVVRFLFGDLARDGRARALSSFSTSIAIGDAAATPFDGVSPQ